MLASDFAAVELRVARWNKSYAEDVREYVVSFLQLGRHEMDASITQGLMVDSYLHFRSRLTSWMATLHKKNTKTKQKSVLQLICLSYLCAYIRTMQTYNGTN